MAQRRKNDGLLKKTLSAIVLIIAALFAYSASKGEEGKPLPVPGNGELAVHFLDVGQGHSTLVQSGSSGVLIDAGEEEYGQKVCEYLRQLGIEKLSCVIATHPHSDHIGGMAKVLDSFACDRLYAPELSEKNIPTTSTYEKLLGAIEENGVDARYARAGDRFRFSGATFDFFGPVKQMDDLNNMSLIVKLTYGKNTVLITGDAENKEMKTLADLPYSFKADIYLLSHHGSRTGLYTDFLKLVSPETVVISCGKDNDYGHPHKEVLQYISNKKLTSYRTDTQGSISFLMDKSSYTVSCER